MNAKSFKVSSGAYSTTSRELDREHDGRRNRDLDLFTKLGTDPDAIRAAFVRTIWTLTRGVSDPARRACADPDAREAGSLTRPSLPPLLSSAGGPAGTKRRPTQTLTTAQVLAPVGLCRRGVWSGDDRSCTAVITMPMVDGAGGQLDIVPPSRPPSVSRPAADASFQGRRERCRWMGAAALGVTIRERLGEPKVPQRSRRSVVTYM